MHTQLAQAAEIPSPPAELPHINSRIDHAVSRVHEIATVLEAHADALFGARPSNIAAAVATALPEAHCLMAALDQTLLRLHSAIDRLHDEAARNTRLA